MAAILLRTVAILVTCQTLVNAESHVGFLGHQNDGINDNVVSMEDLERSLRESLDSVLSASASKRLVAIEASIWRSFQAMPKNSLGRLDPRGVRHIVHSYFAKEHGWLINGLEPHGMTANVSEVHDVSILKDKAPALVESLLETRQVGRGLLLPDVVAMVAALERLIFDESLALLQVAYQLNGYALQDELDEPALHEVLRSYLLLFGQGHQADVSNVRKHQDMKAKLKWPELDDFQYGVVQNLGYEHRHEVNPFTPRVYTFSDATNIVNELAQTYGKWQNAECSAMKEHLMDLDPEGSGRVPLDAFHTQPDGSMYQFTESLSYLRQVGAVDETTRGNPRVLIANYISGPSNCIASSSYYSVCCLNECEGLLNEVEGAVQAPTASPAQLLSVVSNIHSATVDAPRQLPSTLVSKLDSIAEMNGGMVPIQGRLFAQWLHFAFPNECPYPTIVENSAVLTPNEWTGMKSQASLEERQRANATREVAQEPRDLSLAQWSDDEVLPLLAPSFSISAMLGGALRSLLRFAASLGGLWLALQAGLAAVATVQTALAGQDAKMQRKQQFTHVDHVSSMYV